MVDLAKRTMYDTTKYINMNSLAKTAEVKESLKQTRFSKSSSNIAKKYNTNDSSREHLNTNNINIESNPQLNKK